MKKKLLAIISIAAIFTSCSEIVETVQEEITPSRNEKVVLRASVPEADTKVSSDNAGAFAWQVGDKVTVLNIDGTPYEFETEDGGTAVDFSSATFTGTLSEEAFYPASDNHKPGKFYLEPSIDWAANASGMPMLGTVNRSELTASFVSVGAVLKLICYNVDKNADNLVITSNSKRLLVSLLLLEKQRRLHQRILTRTRSLLLISTRRIPTEIWCFTFLSLQARSEH